NIQIHHDEELVRLVESLETAFSSIKTWIKHHRDFFDSSDNPVYTLKVACAYITSNMANAFFNASIYSE
ncbi:6477_t:CDS:2, partial [Cetraspora pellucida]